ncbi:MAG TPA: RNA methyltransferase [Blastocatellia bacterium]|jgi:TrmH family RNA methyltransferase
MLIEKITSRQNPLVKRFRRVRAGGERHMILLEGVRLIEEALRAGAHFESVAFTSEIEATDRGMALLDALQQVRCRGAHIPRQVMEVFSDTETPQGIAAIASRPYYELESLFARAPQLLIIADRLQDPGNLGAIIRTAEAAGATGLVTTPDTVDPFNHKALRASMGAALRLPLATHVASTEIARLCHEHRVKAFATSTRPARAAGVIEEASRAETIRLYTEIDMAAPVAFLLGREASGVSNEASFQADGLIHIPMASGVESLNVAAAATVLLYEAARQRNFCFGENEKGE